MGTDDPRIREMMQLVNYLKVEATRLDFNVTNSPGGLMNLKELLAVMAIAQAGSLRMRDLADKLNLAVSTMTGIIDKLALLEIVERGRSTEDRRVVHVSLTDKGHILNRWIENESVKAFRRMVEGLNDEELDTLVGLYRKMVQHIRARERSVPQEL